MEIFIPTWVLWVPVVYLGMGLLLLPVMFYMDHKSLKHNLGWTWKTTLFGRRNQWKAPFLWLIGVILWPLALKERL